MVEYTFVVTPNANPRLNRIGVFEALARGFDRIAGRPLLILPPLLLDLLLWLGPRLKLTAMVQSAVDNLPLVAPGAEQALIDQAAVLKQSLMDLGQRFNLLASLSGIPVGIPSLMSSRMPLDTPLGTPAGIEMSDPLLALGVWCLLLTAGLGLGAGYHLLIARLTAKHGEVGSGWVVWGKILAMSFLLYVAVALYGTLVVFAGLMAGLIHQFLGVAVILGGFSLFFWILMYLVFTPHGIVRYGLGVGRAMLESALLVRWNMLGAMGFLMLAVVISLLTSRVWAMPADGSWYSVLALLGHAFVSSVILAASYFFYQGRREWLLGQGEALSGRSVLQRPPRPLA